MRNFAANAESESSFFTANLTSLKIVSLTDNNGSNRDDNSQNFDAMFNPAIAIIIVVLFSILFFMGVFSIYIRRCIMEDDDTRPSSSAGADHNAREADPGLERTVIESFPVFSYSLVKGLKAQAKGSECAVCLSDFEDDDMLRLLPLCSHAFHPECIDMWLCSHKTCPVCRSSLVPETAEFCIVEPEALPEQVAIVVSGRHGSVDLSNDGAANGDTEASHDSTGHWLVRVRKELEQPAEWYIATAEGLTAGLHRSCSFVGMHHSQGSKGAPAGFYKAGGSMGAAGCGARSERWGSISVNPASFLRTFSERFAPQLAESKRFNGRTVGLV